MKALNESLKETEMLALPYDEFSVIAVKAIIEDQQKQIDELRTSLEQLMKVIKIDTTPQVKSVDPAVETVTPNDADQK